MTLSIHFAPAEEARLRERAAAEGIDLETFVRDAALEKADRPTIEELLAPVHHSTESLGVSLDEIDEMADQARRQVREQRRATGQNIVG